MTASLLPVPKARFFDASGSPLIGGKVFSYAAGTTTPKDTYTDSTAGTPNTNPVILDSRGEANIWLAGNYKIILQDSAGVQQWSVDNVADIQTASQISNWVSVIGGTANAITLTPTPAISAYTAGQNYNFLPGFTSTSGTVTIATSGLTPRPVKKTSGGTLTALAPGDFQVGVVAQIVDDGTEYVLTNARTFSHGADIASATTIVLDLITGDLVDVTGTTAITAITLAEGRCATVRFTGILTLTNGASLVLPGGANITTAAGDYAVFRGYASGVVRCIGYSKASGLPIVSPTVPVPYSAISGFLPGVIAGTSTTAAINITAGQATDSTNASFFTGAAFGWAISNGNAANGYQGGSTFPNSSTIHFYVIATATDTAWSATFASLSLTPTLPGSYTKYRRIFSIKTSGAGAPLPYAPFEIAGGAIDCTLSTSVLDVSTTFGTSRTAQALASIPTGVSHEAKYILGLTAGSGLVRLTGLNEPDLAPASTATVGLADIQASGFTAFSHRKLITDTSAQIGIRCGGAGTTVAITTFGWVDFRR